MGAGQSTPAAQAAKRAKTRARYERQYAKDRAFIKAKHAGRASQHRKRMEGIASYKAALAKKQSTLR